MESEWITADGIEATEFPHLANRYSVQGVPKTVINEKFFIEGMMPEYRFVEETLKALDK
jgi:predicted DsbA family dithiol-disulfide isomerase